MTVEALNQEVNAQRGKPGGWPSDLSYMATEGPDSVEVGVGLAHSAKDSVWKKIDSWGLAFFHETKQNTDKPVRLKFSLRCPTLPTTPFQYEALKRRLSYLAEANHLQITLLKESSVDPLYSWTELTNRPESEKVRGGFKPRSDADTPGRLEKDFQTWLFGKGKNTDSGITRTNERLALFGEDFVYVGKIRSAKNLGGYKVEREFPTGAFEQEVKEDNRILPTEFVDLVTLNRNGDLAVIEIKFDDPKLEVIPQVLNYALFFHSYRPKLTKLLNEKLECATEGRNLVAYLVSNTFHEKFKSVWPYYSRPPLTFRRVIMGCMSEHPPGA